MPQPRHSTNENGVTRREFERLQGLVDKIYAEGSPQSAILRERIDALRGEINGQGTRLGAEIERCSHSVEVLRTDMDKDMHSLEATVDKRLQSWTKFGWTLLGMLVISLIGVITTLATGIIGG